MLSLTGVSREDLAVITSLHYLLTYSCTYECDHCFVWGSPSYEATFTVSFLKKTLREAKAAGIDNVYFEGGEPFLHYALMLEGLRMAREEGLERGVVTNAFWATSEENAALCLQPIAEVGISDLSVSSDLFHGDAMLTGLARNALKAAGDLKIRTGLIQCQEIYNQEAGPSLMYRGRAAEVLASKIEGHICAEYTRCPNETLESPRRVHIDPYGWLHLCQGITMGNANEKPLSEIFEGYRPLEHPIVGPLLRGGPVALASMAGMDDQAMFADACHCCYEARKALRKNDKARFLCPDEMYGEKSQQIP